MGFEHSLPPELEERPTAMITRKEYLDNPEIRDAYMAQFITPAVIMWVQRNIGLKALQDSTREWFNDIPLHHWDAFYNTETFAGPISRALRDSGDVNARSIANACSVAKHAARHLLESSKPTN